MPTLTPADVAADLHVSTETVLRHIRQGLIPAFRVGRFWRVDPTELAEWRATGARPTDPNRIPPRSARSQAALKRRRSS